MLALVAALALAAPTGKSLTVDAAKSVVTYRIVHKLHEVEARTTRIEGRAVIQPDGRVQAMARIPVASFDSGDANRDSNMREAVQASRFPFVTVKGVGTLPPGALEGRQPSAHRVQLLAEVDLHGVKEQVEVPLEVTLEAGGAVRVKGSFDISLEQHRVERPSLFFVKVEDACRIGLDLVLREGSP